MGMQRPENSSASPPQGLCFLKSISLFIYFVWRKGGEGEGVKAISFQMEVRTPLRRWPSLPLVSPATFSQTRWPASFQMICPFSPHCMSLEVTLVCHHICFYNLSIIYLLLGTCMLTCVGIRGPPVGICSFVLPLFWKVNSGRQAYVASAFTG